MLSFNWEIYTGLVPINDNLVNTAQSVNINSLNFTVYQKEDRIRQVSSPPLQNYSLQLYISQINFQ
jgi:hypothetical protein